MPALPDVPSVVRTALSGTTSSLGVFLTRFYTQYSGTAPTSAELLTFNGAIASAITSHLLGEWEQDAVCTQIESIDLTSATAGASTDAVSLQGTKTGNYIAAGSCMVVSYEIARRYRGGHPRGYWIPSTAPDLQNPGSWTSAYVAACLSAYEAFFSDVAGAGWSGAGTLTHSNVSYYQGFTVVTNPITGRARNVPTLRSDPIVDAVTSIIPRASVGSQRRRAAFVD